jgi:hypothetical protein
MKKVVLTLTVVLLSFTALFAQEGDLLKPTGGNITLEGNFAPFGGNPFSSGDFIRVRKFMSDYSAFRLGVGAFVMSDNPNANASQVTTGFTVAPGVEKHFEGTNRLSPYVGAELVFTNRSERREVTNPNNNTTILTKNPDGNGWFRFGANALAGADFYFSKHVYIGAELGYGLSFYNIKNTEVEAPAPIGNSTIERGSAFGLGDNLNGRLRLGFVLY